jgi:hypothetical protein
LVLSIFFLIEIKDGKAGVGLDGLSFVENDFPLFDEKRTVDCAIKIVDKYKII